MTELGFVAVHLCTPGWVRDYGGNDIAVPGYWRVDFVDADGKVHRWDCDDLPAAVDLVVSKGFSPHQMDVHCSEGGEADDVAAELNQRFARH
jgi:hypothetical protein